MQLGKAILRRYRGRDPEPGLGQAPAHRAQIGPVRLDDQEPRPIARRVVLVVLTHESGA